MYIIITSFPPLLRLAARLLLTDLELSPGSPSLPWPSSSLSPSVEEISAITIIVMFCFTSLFSSSLVEINGGAELWWWRLNTSHLPYLFPYRARLLISSSLLRFEAQRMSSLHGGHETRGASHLLSFALSLSLYLLLSLSLF
ncbi:hypothetical protein Bca4012_027071 [Brassica carinata]